MQLVYFQFRRLGILVPLFFLVSSISVGVVHYRYFGNARFSSSKLGASAFLCTALLVAILRLSVRRQPEQKIWNDLAEEWETTNDVDEFMYLKLWQWFCFLTAGGLTLLSIGYFQK